jgi:multicopper oxidase
MHSYRSLFLILLGVISLQVAHAATLTYNWDIGWMNYNPDSRQVRPIIAINGKWPSPQIVGNVGDNVIVNVINNLGNQSLTIHWHGLRQVGNNANDGTPMVSQCPIIPGTNYTYTFTVRHWTSRPLLFTKYEIAPTTWDLLVPFPQPRTIHGWPARPAHCT